ncbi:bifunctional solanapyrone synthase [Aspergillus udagawae]|nr:bifunctional solanapyrone synthase [Aspergillus udagawae]
MENRRPSNGLSNDLWSEIRGLLKEQNERLRIQNRLLQQLLLGGDKATGTDTNQYNLPDDDKRDVSIEDAPQRDGRNKSQTSLKSYLKRDDSDSEFQGQGQTLLYAADETLKYPRIYYFVDEGNRPRLHRLSTVLSADTSWKYWKPVAPAGISYPGQYQSYPGAGYPDYIPEWETKRTRDGWCHIDGERLEDEIHVPSGSIYSGKARLVPYSLNCSTSIPSEWVGELGSGFHGGFGKHMVDTIQLLLTLLGNLYAVPCDGRVQFAFDRCQLRNLSPSSLSSHLERLQLFFKTLEASNGRVQIVDLDDWMHAAIYERVTAYPEEWKVILRSKDPRILAVPALEADLRKVNIRPTRFYYTSGNGKPTEVKWREMGHWNRIISCVGLNAVPPLFEYEFDALCHILFRSSTGEKFQYADLVPGILRTHISCVKRRRSRNDSADAPEPFHITWCRIDDTKPSSKSTWRSGELYGSKASISELHLSEVAFTLGFIPSQRTLWSNTQTGKTETVDRSHWCLIHLAPSHFRRLDDSIHRRRQDDPRTAPFTTAITLIEEALQNAANDWDRIANHFDLVLNQNDSVFNPDLHDRFLFDDASFSRSRYYFWLMDSLEGFTSAVSDAIHEWEVYWWARKDVFEDYEAFYLDKWRKTKVELGSPKPPQNPPLLEDSVKRVDIHVARLREILSRLETLRDRTMTLRDGLFNASAVIESRAATQLGENVKLLTYVSIFYLPLSYCAALWSINRDFNQVAFAIVTALLALGTYALVLNLNNVVFLIRNTYRKLRTPILEAMKDDPHEQWANLGSSFSGFMPERHGDQPSEWMVLLYALLMGTEKLKFWKRGHCDPIGDKLERK